MTKRRKSIVGGLIAVLAVCSGLIYAAGKSHRRGTVLPAECTVGEVYVLLGAPDPAAICTATDTWSLHGGSVTHDSLAVGIVTGSSGTTFIIGSYEFGLSDNDFNPSVNFGSANVAHGSRFFLVQAAGAGGGDTTVRVTGTSILGAVSTPADTEDLIVSDAAAAGTYYSTLKRWNGELTISQLSGPDLLMNFGLATWYDRGATDFTLTSLAAQAFGGANDSGFDLQILKHSALGWTYVPAGEPLPAAPGASSLSDMTPNHEVANGKEWSWDRPSLNIIVAGASGEGLIARAVTTTNNTIAHGTVLATLVPQ